MIIVGLTGPTGAGKSSLTAVAEKIGFKVIDCDKTARYATEKGSQGLKAVTNAFGEDILLADGSLNRRALAQKAFSSKENTRLLNRTLLPFIVQLVMKECDGERVLLDAPTLFESGLQAKCNATVAVLADEKIRMKRICLRDKISQEDAILRINAGKPHEFYKENADFIIYNNGNAAEFEEQFRDILKEIVRRRDNE